MLKRLALAKSALLLISLVYLLSLGSSESNANATTTTFSPYDVPSSIQNINLAGTNKGNRSLPEITGKKLVYDVYSGNTTNALKQGWKIETKNFGKGSEKYLTFTGWSAIMGHRHHYSDNQETYILLRDKKTNARKVYKAEQTSLNASKDLEYNRLSDPNQIYNPCSSSATNKMTQECNMYYENVGFKAYLPLNDLFPTGLQNASWELYIIKKVGTTVLWDDLRIPFQFDDIAYGQGNIALTSGINANRLMMNADSVIRRDKPRGVGSGSTWGYFEIGRTYQKEVQSEEYTAVWYGVKSPHDKNQTRWAISPYWNFGGTIATLSYDMDKKTCPDGSRVYLNEDCQAIVTIKHIDGRTGKFLDTETRKLTVGKSYSLSAKTRGTYTDSQGRPYVPTPIDQKATGTVPNNNFTVNFYYKVALENPSFIGELSGSTTGIASGLFEWKLDKEGNVNSLVLDESQSSVLKVINQPKIAGKHFATRNVKYKVSSPSINQESNNPIEVTISNPNDVKDQNISYEFSYEYTNHYQAVYECVDQQGSDCFEWKFKSYDPVWSSGYVKYPKWNATLTVNHNYGDTFIIDRLDNSKIDLRIGQRAVLGKENEEIQTYSNEEHFILDNSAISLLTQNWMGINEGIQYDSDLGNPIYVIPKNIYYFPNDLDRNLRNQYKNETSFNYTSYAIPLEVSPEIKSNLVTFLTKDNFYVTKKEGFLFSAPKNISNKSEIEQKAKIEYEKTYGVNYEDEVLTSYKDGSRFYFNIDGNGEEKAGEWYRHAFVFETLGLSDIKIHILKDVRFEKYLMGSPLDNVVVAEEYTSVDYNIDYPHSIIIPKEKQSEIANLNTKLPLIHAFRLMSDNEIYEMLKSILPSLDE